MKNKIKCPFHADDNTPSLHLYATAYYCFACQKRGPLSDLGVIPLPANAEVIEPEDIQDSIDYIRTFPKKEIRGLSFHTDDFGYYIIWPEDRYYKYRRFTDVAPKYIGPRGIKPPPFYLKHNRNAIIVVEGEINAISLTKTDFVLSILSPGSAANFDKLDLTYLRDYERILVLVDNDIPGRDAALKLQYKLRQMGKITAGRAMKEDCNEVLVKYGKERLQQEIGQYLEALSRKR